MGKREELIEAAARAMVKRVADDARLATVPAALHVDHYWHEWKDDAEIALDAILAGLKTPSEEMLDAADMADELEGDYPDGRNRAIWKAMLSTLEETKP